MRIPEKTPELEAAEIAWWQKFADVEERFCWVQTPSIQRALRAHYLKRIIASLPAGGRVLELGCGCGWLSILLARMGAAKVVGVDFSEAQIGRARAQARSLGVSGRVQFEVADGSNYTGIGRRYDVVLFHAFLHHLTTSEIREVLGSVHRLLDPAGRLVIFEPVRYPEEPISAHTRRLIGLFEFIRGGLTRGRKWGLRRFSVEETRLRQLISERSVGHAPFGPSPKEIPMAVDELPRLTSDLYTIRERSRCMWASHLIAQELLLMQVSHPVLGRLLSVLLVPVAAWLDRSLLREGPMPSECWIFEMFVCEPRPPREASRPLIPDARARESVRCGPT